MRFRKNSKAIKEHKKSFGKNIIITDNHDWSTDEIVKAGSDRHVVENVFRQSKDNEPVCVLPMRHWTDSKIRCHILSCVVALTYLRLIEIHLQKAGLKMSVSSVMSELNKLHSCLCYYPKKRKPIRKIEEPTEAQIQILKAFNYRITSSGVLQSIT